MRLPRKTLIFAGIGSVLIISVALFLLLRMFYPISPGTMLKIISERADLEARDVLYREVREDGVTWEIRAKKASYIKKENRAFFDQAEVKLGLADGRTISLAGDKGKFDTITGNMEIWGKVSVATTSGEHFTTDDLQYTAASKTFHTASFVEMATSRLQIQGVGMSLSLPQRKIVLLSRVYARIR